MELVREPALYGTDSAGLDAAGVIPAAEDPEDGCG
jgi:hypothetical protein